MSQWVYKEDWQYDSPTGPLQTCGTGDIYQQRITSHAQQLLFQDVCQFASNNLVQTVIGRRYLANYLCKLHRLRTVIDFHQTDIPSNTFGDLLEEYTTRFTQYVFSIVSVDFEHDIMKTPLEGKLFAQNVGLQNTGVSCWLNTSLAILLRLSGIRDHLDIVQCERNTTMGFMKEIKRRMEQIPNTKSTSLRFSPRDLGWQEQCEDIGDILKRLVDGDDDPNGFPDDLIQMITTGGGQSNVPLESISLQQTIDSIIMEKSVLTIIPKYLMVDTFNLDAHNERRFNNIWYPQRLYVQGYEYRLVAGVKRDPMHFTAIVRFENSMAAMEYNDTQTIFFPAYFDILTDPSVKYIVAVYKIVNQDELLSHDRMLSNQSELEEAEKIIHHTVGQLDYHGVPSYDVLQWMRDIKAKTSPVTLQTFLDVLYTWWTNDVFIMGIDRKTMDQNTNNSLIEIISDSCLVCPMNDSELCIPSLEKLGAVELWGIIWCAYNQTYRLFPLVYMQFSENTLQYVSRLVHTRHQSEEETRFLERNEKMRHEWMDAIFDRRPYLRDMFEKGYLKLVHVGYSMEKELQAGMVTFISYTFSDIEESVKEKEKKTKDMSGISFIQNRAQEAEGQGLSSNFTSARYSTAHGITGNGTTGNQGFFRRTSINAERPPSSGYGQGQMGYQTQLPSETETEEKKVERLERQVREYKGYAREIQAIERHLEKIKKEYQIDGTENNVKVIFEEALRQAQDENTTTQPETFEQFRVTSDLNSMARKALQDVDPKYNPTDAYSQLIDILRNAKQYAETAQTPFQRE